MTYFTIFLVLVGLISWKPTFAAPIPSQEIKQVVGFIFVQRNKEGKWDPKGKWEPNGTAFFVGIDDTKDPGRMFVYLVTAKHVLQYQPDPKNRSRQEWFPEARLRLNTTDGQADFVRGPIVISGDKKNVFLHEEDKTVDIAVLPVGIDRKRFEFKAVPQQMITTEKDFRDLQITEGSEVFFTGLFTPYLGVRRNYPIIRFGKVSLITEEKIKFDNVEANLYLIESGSFGGNSGSPVYFYLGADRRPGTLTLGDPILKLAGVMSGTFLDLQPITVVETSQIPVARSSMGIAAVVPAYKLHEILFGKELTKTRSK